MMRFSTALMLLSAGGALAHPGCACMTGEQAEELIANYVTVFEGIPPNGTVETVEALAKKTFAPDVKMYSQSLLWVHNYKGPVSS